MQKRTLRYVLIMLVLLTLTGCASIQTRVSSCQQMFANTFSANNRIPRIEREALLAFDEATQGGIVPAAVGSFPCKYTPPPCQWNGVVCTSGHVTELNFNFRQLSGEIPAELENLSELWRLELGVNQLSGTIPPELGNLSQLGWLGLGRNQLSGEIPAELGNLSQLRLIGLSDNRLSGEIPVEIGNLSQLQLLNLSNNQLSGEIPAELGNLAELNFLRLESNQLGGDIPPELGNLPQLHLLHLDNNQLSGSLPGELLELPVKELYLSGTGLCVPQTPEFEAWIAGIEDRDFDEVPYCE